MLLCVARAVFTAVTLQAQGGFASHFLIGHIIAVQQIWVVRALCSFGSARHHSLCGSCPKVQVWKVQVRKLSQGQPRAPFLVVFFRAGCFHLCLSTRVRRTLLSS